MDTHPILLEPLFLTKGLAEHLSQISPKETKNSSITITVDCSCCSVNFKGKRANEAVNAHRRTCSDLLVMEPLLINFTRLLNFQENINRAKIVKFDFDKLTLKHNGSTIKQVMCPKEEKSGINSVYICSSTNFQ